MVARLKIFDGLDYLKQDLSMPAPLPDDGEWTLLTICAVALPWSGAARFELEMESGGVGGVEVGRVMIAQVGTPWK